MQVSLGLIDESAFTDYAGAMPFTLHAPAKVNLRLEVLGKRPDGYHELRMVMVKLALADVLAGEFTPGGMVLASDHPSFPCDERNILWKTWWLLQRETGRRFGLKLHVQKKIPMAAGLGGGSSDAGTLLAYLNQALGLGFSPERLTQLALRLGADVPLFVAPGPAYWAEGVGERLTPLHLPPLYLVLINPGFPVSTAEIFKKFRALTSTNSDASQPKFCRGWREILPLLRNDLEAVTIDSYPAVGLVKQALHASGADGVLMSGSGPTVFGIYSSQSAQARAYQQLVVAHPHWWVEQTNNLGGLDSNQD